MGGVSLTDRCYVGFLSNGPASGCVVGVAEAEYYARGADRVGCCQGRLVACSAFSLGGVVFGVCAEEVAFLAESGFVCWVWVSCAWACVLEVCDHCLSGCCLDGRVRVHGVGYI